MYKHVTLVKYALVILSISKAAQSEELLSMKTLSANIF